MYTKKKAAKRQAELKGSRQLYTPKTGSKSDGGSPTTKLADLGYLGDKGQTSTEEDRNKEELGPRKLDLDEDFENVRVEEDKEKEKQKEESKALFQTTQDSSQTSSVGSTELPMDK